jgi:hypothetical protein
LHDNIRTLTTAGGRYEPGQAGIATSQLATNTMNVACKRAHARKLRQKNTVSRCCTRSKQEKGQIAVPRQQYRGKHMSPAADTCHTRAQRPAHQPAGNWGLCTCTQTSPRPQTHMPTETRHHNKHAPLPKKQRPHHQKLSWQNKPGLYEGQHKFINGGGRVLSAQAVGSQCKNASQPLTHKTQDTGPELPTEQPALHHPNIHQPKTHQTDIEVVRPTVQPA